MRINDFQDTKPMGLYEVAIGEKNQDYYLSKFEDFDDKGQGLHASWNWAAFFFTGFWALYRKMYVWFFAWWFIATVGVVFEKVPNSVIQLVVALITLACLLCFSVYANSLYHHKIKKRIAAAQKSNSDASRVSRRLSAASGVNKWVPIVCGAVPVIGVLAAIALPAYQDFTKRQTVSAGAVQTPAAQAKPNFFDQFDKPASPAQAAEHGPWEDYQNGTPAPKVDLAYTQAPAPAPAPQIDGSQFKPSANSPTGANAPKPAQPQVIHEPKQREGFSPEVQADLNFIAARAMSDYPYLDTPEGSVVMEKIVKMRDDLIKKGVYPAMALTQAVNNYAPLNGPVPVQEKKIAPVEEEKSKYMPGCRWITPHEWSCK